MNDKIVNVLNKIHLYYLGAIPVIATFFIMQATSQSGGVWTMLLLFGSAVVGVYLAMIASYREPIRNIWFLILAIADGPIFGALSSMGGINFSKIVTNVFLIENIAIWISIGVLAGTMKDLSRKERIAPMVLAVVILAAIGALFYKIGFFAQSPIAYIFIGLGAIEALIIKFKILKEDDVVNDADDSMGFIIVFITLWVATLIVGGIISKNQ